jgi:hypothetical protein
MKNLLICLTLAGLIVLGLGCKKDDTPNPNAQLIAATYTVTKMEVSNTNNGIDWVDITSQFHAPVLTLGDKQQFTGKFLDIKTGMFAIESVKGMWSLSTDGNTLTLAVSDQKQDFIISSLTATGMVVTAKGPFYILNPWSSALYPYLRVTYKRS